MHESGEYRFKRVCLSMRVCGAGIVALVGVRPILRAFLLTCVCVHTTACVHEGVHEGVHAHANECVCLCIRVRAHVRAGACVCSRVCVCTFPNMCARGRAHVCACTCARALFSPGIALPLLAPRAGTRIPRGGKAGRSRNPHTEPTLLPATTGGAGNECPVHSHPKLWAYTRGHIRPKRRSRLGRPS